KEWSPVTDSGGGGVCCVLRWWCGFVTDSAVVEVFLSVYVDLVCIPVSVLCLIWERTV
ncbi:hypothetical protein A2U01_0097918, partial [Trifolium medium]|nr:hypothetical protein [Trifolium medium]